MTFETIEVEQKSGVGIIRLNQPSTLNAVTGQMIEDITAAVDELSGTSRALLLTGAGKAFCSGANLTSTPTTPANEQFDAGALLETHLNPLMTQLASLRIPWISAVNGAAVGVGCSLALAADLIVASENAYFLQAFTRVGLAPDGGSSWLLNRAIGRARAMEMMLLAERVSAVQALEWGLINRVFPASELDDAAFALAATLAAGPTRALSLARRLGWLAADTGWTQILAAERLAQREAGNTVDFSEGVRAFVEKRAPQFRGE